MNNRNRWKNRKGFTMAEMLLAVAIIIILASLIFVGVSRYLRSLHLMEMDNAAKEIFYAAQNRITAELNSGTLGRLKDEEFSADKQHATGKGMVNDSVLPAPYAIIHSSDVGNLNSTLRASTLWDEMLPFGSIDDTLRIGGSYIITYSYDKGANIATVLDVWYASDVNTGIGRNWDGSEHALIDEAEYDDLKAARIINDRKNRLRFPNGTGNAIVGHYGRDDINVLDKLYNFKDLEFTLVNDEILYGDFKFTAENLRSSEDDKTMTAESVLSTLEPQLKLTITGFDSQGSLTLRYDTKQHKLYRFDTSTPVETGIVKVLNESGTTLSYRFILDNITKDGQRFRDLVGTPDDGSKLFVFGEDIRVNVEVYSNTALANIDSASAVDNSLFQYVKPSTTDGSAEAGVGKVRHLQNLSSAVSGVKLGLKNDAHADRLGINSAKQTADLVWDTESHHAGFVNFTLPGDSTPIGGNIFYNKNASETVHTVNSFYPIDLTKSVNSETFGDSYLTYDGEYTVEAAEDPAENIMSSHSISNLVVNDSSVNHAGIFGTVGADKEQPIPKDSSGKERFLLKVRNLEINAPKITGKNTAGTVVANEVNAVNLNNITINNAEVAASNGNAGGAVGQAVNGLTIESVAVSESHVSASGHAGGLVGQFDGVYKDVHIMINKSFVQNSTEPETTTATYNPGFSVISTGADNSAGGLVGAITQGYPQIFNSYSTALVKGDTAGGLIGEIINSHMNTDKSEIGIIRDCYVGGHVTKNAATGMPVYSDTKYNVTGTKIAGGFIGSFEAGSDSGITVLNSYSTASASGETAGGFVGNAAGEGTGSYRISDCYAVGLVKDTNPDDVNTPSGAFAGNVGTLLFSGDRYFELISKGLPAVGNTSANPTEVFSAETNLQTYNSFVQVRKEGTFDPYHKSLDDMFGTIYYLPTVKDLDSGADKSMSIHVGDWQPVDTLVTNTPDGT